MNQITLIGRCGKDPEVKYLDSGKCVAKVSIAVNRRKKDGGTDWFNCTAWDKTAEVMANYVKKGSQIAVTGSLEFQEYEKDGVKRQTHTVTISNLELLGSKNEAPAPEDNDAF